MILRDHRGLGSSGDGFSEHEGESPTSDQNGSSEDGDEDEDDQGSSGIRPYGILIRSLNAKGISGQPQSKKRKLDGEGAQFLGSHRESGIRRLQDMTKSDGDNAGLEEAENDTEAVDEVGNVNGEEELNEVDCKF
jgi:hypothetical protein